MKISITAQQTIIGVLPYDQMLSGSEGIGDVVNSWITYVNRAMVALPTHPLSILNKSIPSLIGTAASLADTFALDFNTDGNDNDLDVIIFKGKEYYVCDYETDDAARTEVTLECIRKDIQDQIDAEHTNNSVELETLDLLFAFVTSQLANALNNAAFAKQTSHPVGIASPALPTTPAPTGGPYKTLPHPPIAAQTSAQKATFKSSGGVDLDVAAAQSALVALLQKGSL